jgi:signal peptidase I
MKLEKSIKVWHVIYVSLFIFALYLILKTFNLQFAIPESESVTGSLFLIQDKNKSNDYVIFKYNSIDYKSYHKDKLFIKKVGCDSGQHLSVKDHKVVCDKKIIATVFEKNGEGDILPSFYYDGIIPDNKFFALGEHVRSFDSRYFGLVEKIQITNSARRVF